MFDESRLLASGPEWSIRCRFASWLRDDFVDRGLRNRRCGCEGAAPAAWSTSPILYNGRDSRRCWVLRRVSAVLEVVLGSGNDKKVAPSQHYVIVLI